MKLHLPMTLFGSSPRMSFHPHAATAARQPGQGRKAITLTWTLNGTPDSSPGTGTPFTRMRIPSYSEPWRDRHLLKPLISSTVTPAGLTFNSDTSYTLKGTGAMAGRRNPQQIRDFHPCALKHPTPTSPAPSIWMEAFWSWAPMACWEQEKSSGEEVRSNTEKASTDISTT